MRPETGFEFVCPRCGERIVVNASMRRAMLEGGCVVCDASVSPSDFSPVG